MRVVRRPPPPNLDPGPGADRLGRYSSDLAARARASIDAVIAHPHPSPAELHDLHRDLRRLRVLAKWWSRVAPIRRRSSIAEFSRRLGRIARLVGSVRDLDVELDLYSDLVRREPVPTARMHRFAIHLREGARTGRELLRATLRSERHGGLYERTEAELDGIGTERNWAALGVAFASERRSLAKRATWARRRSLRTASPDDLHALRIRVRRLRYLTDVEDALAGATASTFPRRYARLQRRLGTLHDRDVLAQHLARADPDGARAPWRKRFGSETETLRRSLLEELPHLRPKRHLGAATRGRAARLPPASHRPGAGRRNPTR